MLSSANLEKINYFDLINALKKKAKNLPPSTDPRVLNNIAQIKAHCEKKHSQQSYLGGAALNQNIIRDPQIKSWLTPETFLEIIREDANISKGSLTLANPICLYRDTDNHTTIAQAFQYGLNEGLEVIKLMPSNVFEATYETEFKQQLASYETTVLPNLRTIATVAQQLGVNISYMAPEEKITLDDHYDRLLKVIFKIKEEKLSNRLLSVNGYSAQQMRDQSVAGFNSLLKKLGPIEGYDKKSVLINFAEKCMNNPAAMIAGYVSHMFYDRAHFEACMEQDTPVIINGQSCQLFEVLGGLVHVCEESKKISVLSEQLRIRLKLIDKDLRTRFTAIYNEVVREEREDALAASQYDMPLASFAASSFTAVKLEETKDSFSYPLGSLSKNTPAVISTPKLPAITDAPKTALVEETSEAKQSKMKQDIRQLILNRSYDLGCMGGTRIELHNHATRKVSAGAAAIYALVNNAKEVKDLEGQIQNLLKDKLTTTWGFFGLGSRRQTTVDLYNDILKITRKK